MNVTAHFDAFEFRRKARPQKGFPQEVLYPTKWLQTRLKPLCDTLEVIRAAFGRPLVVISGYRDPEYNRAIGGARYSQHMEGRAADIIISNVPAAEVHDAVLELYRNGRLLKLGGLGSYPNFTHVDVRKAIKLARWEGSRAES